MRNPAVGGGDRDDDDRLGRIAAEPTPPHADNASALVDVIEKSSSQRIHVEIHGFNGTRKARICVYELTRRGWRPTGRVIVCKREGLPALAAALLRAEELLG